MRKNVKIPPHFLSKNLNHFFFRQRKTIKHFLSSRILQHIITCVTELKRNINDLHGVGCLVLATTDMINILDTESFKILPDKYEVTIFSVQLFDII